MASDIKRMGFSHLSRRRVIASFGLLAAMALSGCGSHDKAADLKPKFDASEGAISGEIIGTDRDPFDLELAGGKDKLKIELLSPVSGVAATAYPLDKKAHFLFSHVPPGRYELTVFVTVAGKRSIAGNLPVTVDPDQVFPAKLMLTVTPVESPN